jgi:UDP-N-acetyl-D-galactosamine dehydrogenase|tara:strand:+ start:240 stop:1013 length:774 start_codon:yes stop_codon:yes gene_type:complete
LSQIKKVTSGSTPDIAQNIDALYNSIIDAGTHLAPSIRVAEAAKVIENAQRDINIAFVNELSIIFDKLDIKTKDVLDAAQTKWNFPPFKPGLVGGHCIGVDPYYLTHKAEQVGYTPEIILAGRRLNDSMGYYAARQIIKLMIDKDLKIDEAGVLILGIVFKENCPDIRNSKVIDVITELKDSGCQVDVYDPWADAGEVLDEYGLELVEDEVLSNLDQYAVIVLAVAHDDFKILDLRPNDQQIIYDIKSVLPEFHGSF